VVSGGQVEKTNSVLDRNEMEILVDMLFLLHILHGGVW
jgi:hypothetical protein